MQITPEGDLLLDSFKWSGTKAKLPGLYEKFPPGAYVCMIIDINFKSFKNGNIQAIFDVDIVEGDHAGHFTERAKKQNNVWPYAAQFKRYVFRADEGEYSKDFKGFVEFLSRQNPQFKVPEDKIEREKLIGLYCGFTFGEEEYEANDGSLKIACKLQFPCAVADVREGKVKTPEIRKLDDSKRSYKPNNSDSDSVFSGTSVPDDDVPF